ncbi:MAG TPA: carbohydrate-binding protein, partial [Armatimonadota bacterium]|nr:carbohydrate-binding protein [Armatimonadota bacterium]
PGMGKYRVLVDLMGNKYLGGKTVFYLVDGLWSGSEAVDPPRKFQMAPFNGDWTSSVFVSQDPVALESVCFDFLRTEFKHGNPYSDAPQMDGVDDHLEQAADPSKWPAGITYAPNGDGVPLTSLGVHEHWNNAIDKQYSRNLYPLNGAGIEFVKEEGVSDAVFAVNCGGGSYTDNDGTLYAADKNFTGGTAATTTAAISGTTDQAIYQSERWGNATYTINGVTDGTYAIKFQFAETYWSASNKRVFDVVVGNQTVISKLDIYAQVGKNTAYDITKNVSVTGGTLTISFTNATVDQPKICAFRISKVSESNIGPVANAGSDQIVSINTPVVLDGRGSYDPDNKPSPLTYSWSCLSHNIAINGSNTAQPTFTPTAAGTYTFELMVGDGALIAKDQVVITVTGSGITLPGRIEAENYKAGGENVGYHDLTTGNTGGAYKPNDNVDIEATSDIGGGYNVGWIDANEWLAYDVNVLTAGTYKFTARMASANVGTKTITVTVDGNPLTTISSTTSSGWQAWADALSANVSLTAGNHVVRLTFSGGFNLNYVDITSATPTPGTLQFSSATYTVNENGSNALITLSRANGSEGPVSVNYTTSNGTATAGTDYTTTSGTLTFGAGVTSQTFSVPIIDDQSVEGNETVNLSLSNPTGGATLGSPTSAVLTIIDNDQSGITLPGRIQGEDYMSGGEGVGYHDLTSGNTGGAYKPNDNVDIEPTTDAGGGYNVGWIDATEWLSYNVNVAASGAYSLTARLASGNAGTKTLTMTVDGTTVGTFSFTDASGWQSWKDVAVSNVNLTAGSHVVRLIATTGGFNLNYVDIATQGNIAPVANAGPDFSAGANTLVTLDGYSSTDPDNGPSALTYAWSQVSGPTVSINAPAH